jgi:cobalamin synthase
MLIMALVCGFMLTGRQGFVLLVQLAGYALALKKGVASLEGMNGDISGYALTLSELAAVAAWALM